MIHLYKKNSLLKYNLTILFFFLISDTTLSQEKKSILSIHYNPTNYDYWWLNNNNYGKHIREKEIEYKWELKTQKTFYKIEISNAYKENGKIDFGQSFIKHNLSDDTFLRIGKYYRDFSQYLNDDLSAGSMLVSKNAEAMPKIGLVTSKYIKKKDNISFDFGISHGFFDKSGRGFKQHYTKAPFLHEKFIYIHIKKDSSQVSFGIVHEAMWAGGTPELGNLPSTFKDFLKILIAADGPYEGGPHANALGNHLGIWDLHYQKKKDNKILNLYYQHFFEDTSSLRLRNEIDGLWGVELENYIPNTSILFEYLDTTHCCIDPPYQDDNYYANYQYTAGWSYKNNILGNPFIINTAAFRELLKVLHLGVNSKNSSFYYQLKASRKINITDDIRYKMVIGKKFRNNLDINLFIVNNGANHGLGTKVSYIF